MIVRWDQSDVEGMTVERAAELREQITGTVMASDQADRMSTFNLLFALDKHIGQAPATAEDRAASAREFLHPSNNDARQRAWVVAVSLHGSEREAQRRGYSNPSDAA